jgi:hypothetical protein
MTRVAKEWGAEGDDLGLVSDPGWKPQDLRLRLDWIEDGCIRSLAGMSIITALRSEPFGDAYYAAHMLLSIARIRRAQSGQYGRCYLRRD